MSDSVTFPSHYTWLIPVDTRPSQCLHVCIKQKDQKESLNVVVSDYECLHGHRASHLMAEMVSGTDSRYHIDIEEPTHCDVLSALQFVHADAPHLTLKSCSALTYAHTAHFLHMKRLAEEVIVCASVVIRDMSSSVEKAKTHLPDCLSSSSSADTNNVDENDNDFCGSGSCLSRRSEETFLSPWDAIAVLTLLGDSDKVLSSVSLEQWYARNPQLFQHPSLFSSCHFFGPQKFADIMKMVNTHHRQELIEAKAQSSRRLQGCTALASSLLCDLRSVLRGYVGRRVLARKPPGVLVESGDFTVEEAGQRNVLRSRGRPVRCSKGDGAMKYP